MRLVFATNNTHKLQEIRAAVGETHEIISLKELGFTGDIPEEQETIEGNASQKAFYIYEKYNLNCFADDTGLEIDALNGAPGVISARYAGPECSPLDNMEKVLNELAHVDNRKAQFRTVISLVIEGKEVQFEGIVIGEILKSKHGEKGFGYDPIFLPKGYECSFAEMDMHIKNEISHRGLATKKLIAYLQNV